MSSPLKKFSYKYTQPPGLRKIKGKDRPGEGYKPHMQVYLYSPKKPKPICVEGLLDSGADTLFLPAWMADALELPRLEKIETSGIMKKDVCYKTKVGFILGKTKARRLDLGLIDAVFPEESGDIPLLIGREPIFDYFKIIIQQYDGKFTLEQVKPLPAQE